MEGAYSRASNIAKESVRPTAFVESEPKTKNLRRKSHGPLRKKEEFFGMILEILGKGLKKN